MSLFVLVSVLAASPLSHKTDVFVAGSAVEGRVFAHYRVPAIVVTARGTVLAFAEARLSTRGDWGVQEIVMRRSEDRAKTWDAARVIANLPGEVAPNAVALAQKLDRPGDTTYNNVVPIVDRRDGALVVLFCAEYERCYAMRSTDDARTFSAPADITPVFEEFRREYGWKVIATGPGHGIQLRNGRLLVPVWLSDGTGGHAHRPSIVSVIYSDDHGRTWRRGDVVVRHPVLENPSETIAVELQDGRVMLNIRSESAAHRRAISVSKDGATGWSAPVFQDDLVEPVCMASIVRLDRKTLIFANPDSNEPRDAKQPRGSFKRQNVTVRLSLDDGRSWPVKRTLEPGASGYSDLAVGADGSIYCIYERGTPATLTVARLNREWVMERAKK